MASSNRLVVEVVGDTRKLTSSLNQAQAQINKFAKGTSRPGRGADVAKQFLGDLPAQADRNVAAIKKQDEALEKTNARMQRFALGVAGVGLAVNRAGANLEEFGGNVGKVGKAFQDISQGNIVGFVKSLQSINDANPKKISEDLLALGDASKALHDAAVFSAVGLDQQAAAANNAAQAIIALNNAFVDNTKIRDSTSPGVIAGETSGIATPQTPGRTGRKGITASQRNTFFDQKIARELDRVQDLALSAQVQRLQEIKKEVQARLAKTKDPTRRLTLGDEIVDIDRAIKSVNEEIQNGLKKTAKVLKPVGKKIANTFKQQADDIKSAVLAAFDTKTDKIHNARDLKDAQKTLRQARQLGGAGSIETAMRGVEDANRAITRQRILDTRFSVGEGPRGPVNAVSVGNITFNITTSDPDKVASVVLKKLQLSNRHGSPQGRGRAPGAWTGLH